MYHFSINFAPESLQEKHIKNKVKDEMLNINTKTITNEMLNINNNRGHAKLCQQRHSTTFLLAKRSHSHHDRYMGHCPYLFFKREKALAEATVFWRKDCWLLGWYRWFTTGFATFLDDIEVRTAKRRKGHQLL